MSQTLEQITASLREARGQLEDETRTAQHAFMEAQRLRQSEIKRIEKALETLGAKYRRPGRPPKTK